MADITMCTSNLCKMKEDCLRYTAIPNENYQSWMHYICEDKEWYFISNNERNKEFKK